MKKQQMRGFLRSAEKMVQELQDMQNKEARAEFHRRMEGDEEGAFDANARFFAVAEITYKLNQVRASINDMLEGPGSKLS